MYFLLYTLFKLTSNWPRYTKHMTRRPKSGYDAKLYRFDTTCDGKRFFSTEEQALEAADVRMFENLSATIGVYQCATCRNWHLTSIGMRQKTKR